MAAKYTRSSPKAPVGVTGGMKQVKKQLETLVRGASFTPAARPPVVVAQPWNPLIAIDIGRFSQKTITVKDLSQTICDQVGIYYTSGSTDVRLAIEFRLLKVSIWSRDANISLYPLDFVMDKNIELSRIDGAPAKNQWARVGYSWPASLQAFTLASGVLSDMQDVKLFTFLTAKTSDCELHVKVLWRSSLSKAPSLRWIMLPIEKPRRKKKETAGGESSEEDEGGPHLSNRWPSTSQCSDIEDLKDEVKMLREQLSHLQSDTGQLL